MPSKNSYTYYYLFLRCLRKNLDKQVEDQKKDKYISKPEILCWADTGRHKNLLGVNDIFESFKHIFGKLIEKAPSACMGADDWLDQFFHGAEKALCPGIWCHNEHCKSNDGRDPYNCSAGNVPGKCKIWKAWRFQWRSYPANEVCQKCRYFKPYERDCFSIKHAKRWEEANKYRCLCRARKLPENCPKGEKINAK
jgi:hypothetical protein